MIIGHSKPKLLLVEDELLHVINECREQFSEVNVYTNTIITVGNSLSEHSFTSLLNGYSEVNEAKVDETDPAYILYTSGTTGRPKGAILSHVNIIHSLIHYKTGLQTTDEMRTMIAVPLFHVTGLIAQLLHMVFIGGSAVILKKYNNEKYIKQSFETKVNFHFNVPTIFIMMSTSPLIKNYPFDFVRLVAFGGSPIYLQTLQKLKELFPNANFHNVYGATETASPTTMMPTEYPMTKATSVGLPVKNAQIKIVDSTGKELGANEVGEILIKGPMVIGGYLDNDEANQTTFVDGYWKSGDIAKIDEDGFVYILDRIKDMINRGGEKIFSIEVEDVLKSHPEVIEAAIISIPDEIYGEKVKAIIVSDTLNESTIPQIKEYCLQKLAKYKVPEVFEFVKELPKTASGKILKHVLKQR
ncbi:MAG TPA: acyl--CoA ligase [Bacilli bacterium]|nr:acyl--CoA ligase [Bacilli bacterium]